MAPADQKIELIRSVPLFSRCDEDEVEAIASAADMIDVPAGMQLVAEGQHTNEFVVIAEGAADVTQNTVKVAGLGPGDFFGEIALLTGSPRTATVTASEPSTLLVLTDRAFWQVTEEMPSIQANALRAVAERLHDDAV